MAIIQETSIGLSIKSCSVDVSAIIHQNNKFVQKYLQLVQCKSSSGDFFGPNLPKNKFLVRN